MSNKTVLSLAAFAIVCLTALIYWPVLQAGFVWDDKNIFHDNAWLRYGDGWKELVFHNFYEWINYFRPLVVALFVLEVRAFDVVAGPMHLVSLGIHLTNTLLVGLLALSLFPERRASRSSAIAASVAMLLYGLHPALIEPVIWISCQAELMVTCFMLLGLLLNTQIAHPVFRAVAVAACFFLAACAKESAVSFPLLLVLIDWMRGAAPYQDGHGRIVARLRSLWQRQWPIYVGVLSAGIAYLGIRYWALGFLVQPHGAQPALSLAHLQTVSYIYMTYWRILIWPMVELGPVHIVDASRFATFGAASFAIDLAAVVLPCGGIWLAWKRKPFGYLIMAVTVALLPVLHIVPVAFDYSLYHERYAMTAVAMACALLPCVVASIALPRVQLRRFAIAASAITLAWLGLAVMNIRVTLPLWSDETKLWLWVLQEHPESTAAKNHLLSTYIELNDHVHARQVADMLMADDEICPICMVNIASLAVADGDMARAAIALEKAKQTISPHSEPSLVQGFILATGQLREMKHDLQGAELAYRDAIAMEPMDPQAQMNLALLLARQGNAPEARKQAELALSLLAPDQRKAQGKFFEETLDAYSKPPNGPSP